jgi:hypothetical protein
VQRPHVALPRAEQLLVQLLAGRESGVDDVAWPGRLLDHLPGHLGDPHRLAHLQHERLAVAADRRRLDDELHRLLDGHEVPGDVRVGHRDRAAGRDLGAERGEHRAAAAEHVAEPHVEERAVVRWPRAR